VLRAAQRWPLSAAESAVYGLRMALRTVASDLCRPAYVPPPPCRGEGPKMKRKKKIKEKNKRQKKLKKIFIE